MPQTFQICQNRQNHELKPVLFNTQIPNGILLLSKSYWLTVTVLKRIFDKAYNDFRHKNEICKDLYNTSHSVFTETGNWEKQNDSCETLVFYFFFWLLPLGVIAVVHLLQSHLIMYVTPTLCLSFTAFMHPLFGLLWSFPHFWQLHLQHPSSIISTMPPVHMSKLSPHCLSNVCSLVRFPDVPPRGNRFFLKPRRIGMFSCAHCGHHTGVTVTNKWLNPILITASITSSQYISTHFPCK